MLSAKATHATAWLGAVLAVIALAYTAAGLTRLVTDVEGSFPIDLRLRWIEHRLVVAGLNPQEHGHPDPLLPPTHEFMRTAGGSYPPWAYAIGLLLVPPIGWHWCRVYFALLSMAALGLVARWSYVQAAPSGRRFAVVGALLPFTNFSAAICLSYGQYAVVESGLLVLAMTLLEKRRDGAAGVALAAAFVKPQLAALFVLATVLRRRLVPAMALGVCLVAATLGVAMAFDRDWLSLLRASAVESRYYRQLSHNAAITLLEQHVGYEVAVPLLALLATALMVAGTIRMGREGEWGRLASLGIILSMFWSYRKHYDVAMMTIPLVVLWTAAIRSRRRIDLAAFLVLGATLWVPIRDALWYSPVVQGLHAAVWLAVAGHLMRTAACLPLTSAAASPHGHAPALDRQPGP